MQNKSMSCMNFSPGHQYNSTHQNTMGGSQAGAEGAGFRIALVEAVDIRPAVVDIRPAVVAAVVGVVCAGPLLGSRL